MSSPPPNLAAAAADQADPFLTALSAALPIAGPGGFPTVVAVSGGGDSVALLLGLHRLAVPRLVVAHAEHDLRDEAAADREFVGRLAERLGLPFVWRRLRVRDRDDEAAGEGLEARARRLRYGFLVDAAREAKARHVLVAHTADDQAETILHRILRGTGPAGLAGMPRARELCEGVALLRPLLDASRDSVRAFLRRVAEEWREDASNTDTARARNFLRHEVLPRCTAGPYPVVTAALVRLGGQAADMAAVVASAADHLLNLHGERHADGTVVLRTRPLAGLDPHLVAEMFVALWRREGWPQRDMTARHYESLARATQLPDPPANSLPGGIRTRPLAGGLFWIGRH